MEFVYSVLSYAGYFAILIIFSIIAIIFAKKLHSWIWYSIGAVITLFSLLGNQKMYNNYGGSYYAEEIMTPYWVIYIIILLVVAVIIFSRYSTVESDEKNVPQPNNPNTNNKEESPIPTKTTCIESALHQWRCPNCRNMITNYPCPHCQITDPDEKNYT